MEEAYQYSLKVEDFLIKKHKQRQRGRGGRFHSGIGGSYGESGKSNN